MHQIKDYDDDGMHFKIFHLDIRGNADISRRSMHFAMKAFFFILCTHSTAMYYYYFTSVKWECVSEAI